MEQGGMDDRVRVSSTLACPWHVWVCVVLAYKPHIVDVMLL